MRNPTPLQAGITLMGLLLALLLLSVLASLSSASYRSTLATTQVKIAGKRLVQAFTLARLHAMIGNSRIIVCTADLKAEQQRCDNRQAWHQGWLVFPDFNNNLQRDPNEQLLQIAQLQSGVIIQSKNRSRMIIFTRHGTYLSNATIYICHQTAMENTPGLKLNLANSGITRLYSLTKLECQ